MITPQDILTLITSAFNRFVVVPLDWLSMDGIMTCWQAIVVAFVSGLALKYFTNYERT